MKYIVNRGNRTVAVIEIEGETDKEKTSAILLDAISCILDAPAELLNVVDNV